MVRKISFMILLMSIVGISMAQKQVPIYMDESESLDKRVENALSLMTLEEKVALCHAQSKFSSKGVPRLGIPELWMSDGPHGVRAEILWDNWGYAQWTNDSCTAFPALTCLAATFDPEMSYIYGQAIGEEARYREKDVLLGPGVNIYRTPLNGRNFEYMGEDPYLASKLVVPYIKGVQENGVAACVKHYALNNQEVWRNQVDVEISDRALYEIYLPAFKAAVLEGHTWSIMGSYNNYKGQHCCHNEILINKILKGDWNFDGALITDWGGAHDTNEAAHNGLDIEMGTDTNGLTSEANIGFDAYYLANPFLAKLKSGEYSEALVNDKARRILRLIFRTSMNTKRPWGSLATPEHAAVARKIAESGIVLLKNEKNFLPIDINTTKNILVVGDNATRKMTEGGGSSELKVKYEVSPLSGIKSAFKNAKVSFARGYTAGPPAYGREIPSNLNADSLREEAVEMAKSADIVIFCGGLNKNYLQDCEDGDRIHYELPFGQNELLDKILEVNKNVAVVLISGNAVAMPWQNSVSAILQSWYLGTEAGNAIASVISGEVNPSGKLPFSFPTKLTDLGAHSFGTIAYPGENYKEVYKEDILVGYRWLDTKDIKPMFPFGYGLSYTTFEYGKASINKKYCNKNDVLKLSLELTNTGKVKGAEVVQVYINDKKSSVLRPTKELKAFAKVQLAPGETNKVEIDLPVSEWAFYDESSKEWVVEPGDFNIMIGSSSRDIRQQIPVSVK